MKNADANKTAEIDPTATDLDLGYAKVSTRWQSDPGASRGSARVLAVRTGLRAGLSLNYSKIKWEDGVL
jgi:hypothetical protein